MSDDKVREQQFVDRIHELLGKKIVGIKFGVSALYISLDNGSVVRVPMYATTVTVDGVQYDLIDSR